MKKVILIFAMLFAFNIATAQLDIPMINGFNLFREPKKQISKIQIKSKLALNYSVRNVQKDTVYITIDNWNYDPIKQGYDATITDYIRNEKGYEIINQKNKFFESLKVNQIFKVLNNPILVTKNYTEEIERLLSKALLMETKMDLSEDKKTIYGTFPETWILANQ